MLSNNSESVFEVYYLGMVQNVNQGMSLSQKADVLLIDKVEEAQLEGKIQLIPDSDKRVSFAISERGVRVTDVITKNVNQRHPLHTIAQLVSYTDAFSKSNLVLKTGQFGRQVFDCYVFQCHNEQQAEHISKSLMEEFSVVSDHKL